MTTPNRSAASNGLSAVRSSVAGNCECIVRSTAAAKAVADLDHWFASYAQPRR